MIVLGLTGSIGMGKTATAAMFADEGVPCHDADAAVHAIYAGEDARLVEAAFPGVTGPDGIDRQRLAKKVLGNPEALARLEKIIHPLVRRHEEAFVSHWREKGAPLAVLDIPLLYETGGEARVDKIVVVTAPADIQRARVLARPGMTEEKFQAILARQMPDAEKRRKADFIIGTGEGVEPAREKVRQIIAILTGGQKKGPKN